MYLLLLFTGACIAIHSLGMPPQCMANCLRLSSSSPRTSQLEGQRHSMSLPLQLCSEVKGENLYSHQKISLSFVKSTSILKACHYLGSVFDYAQLNDTIIGRKTAIVGKKPGLELTVVSAGLFPDLLSCQLSPASDPIMCNLNQVASDRFEASYCPSTAGIYQLRVQVGGDILDSPFMVNVIPKQAGWAFTRLACRRGVAITSLVVVENGEHCVTIFNVVNGRKVQTYGSKGSGQVQFNCPYGVAVTQNAHIVIADQFNNSIQVVTVEGAFITSVLGGTKTYILCRSGFTELLV